MTAGSGRGHTTKISRTPATRAGLARLAPTILPFARAEGLEAHAESIEVRLK